jgi:GT2 family glycosyltransferase
VGINYAQRDGAEYVAVLNDDVEFDNGFIPAMLDHLVRHDLAVVDMDNSGNGGGAAWIMDLKYGMRLDERYRWWYGDTELFDRAKAQGRFGKFTYPGFGHLNPNGNLTTNPELMELVRQDTDLYRETYAG